MIVTIIPFVIICCLICLCIQRRCLRSSTAIKNNQRVLYFNTQQRMQRPLEVVRASRVGNVSFVPQSYEATTANLLSNYPSALLSYKDATANLLSNDSPALPSYEDATANLLSNYPSAPPPSPEETTIEQTNSRVYFKRF